MDESIKDEILRSIQTEGSASEENKTINMVFGTKANMEAIAHKASGLPRIKPNIIPQFRMILGQPLSLQGYSPLQIRCAICQRVISYPCWYYNVRYAVNWFHYFVCFDTNSPRQVTTGCYRHG